MKRRTTYVHPPARIRVALVFTPIGLALAIALGIVVVVATISGVTSWLQS